MSQTKKLRTLMKRLEQTATQQGCDFQKPFAASAEQEEILAYLRGDGPQPPCPPYRNPATWESALRVTACLRERVRGALEQGAYLPNMTAEEQRKVDYKVFVIAQWDWGAAVDQSMPQEAVNLCRWGVHAESSSAQRVLDGQMPAFLIEVTSMAQLRKLRTRLLRLEQTAVLPPPGIDTPYDAALASAAHLAYLRGEGPRPPDPPCPRGQDAADWQSRLRVGRCFDARFTGELRADEYVAEMDQEERSYVDGLSKAFAIFVRFGGASPETRQVASAE